MATLAPVRDCMVCGKRLEYEIGRRLPEGVMGPTDWVAKPHECPPEAVDAWRRTFEAHSSIDGGLDEKI